MTDKDGRKGSGGLLIGLLIGGAIGFAAGMMLAPKSGEETRALLAERGNEWRDKAEELAAATKERLSSAAFESRRAASQIRGDGGFDDFDLDGDEL